MIIQPDGRERHGGFYHFIVEFGDVVDGGGNFSASSVRFCLVPRLLNFCISLWLQLCVGGRKRCWAF